MTLRERIDLYNPASNAFLGAEQTWYGPDGRRLRLHTTDSTGATVLLFFVLHDDRGREAEAIYFESSPEPDREVFTYSEDGRLQTTTYYNEPGVAADRTETVLDGAGREVAKRFYRANGSQYGEEDVLWDGDGNKVGWDFRYVGRDGAASFRYRYHAFDKDGAWVRRTRSRDGTPERVEVRTRITASTNAVFLNPVPFAAGRVSTHKSETSPSFTKDGKTMVFARYEDWDTKDPYIAHLEADGWRVEPLREIGSVYNIAIAPDGETIVYATATEPARTLYRMRRVGNRWSTPENLTARYGVTGAYPSLTDEGDLVVYDAAGALGEGVYIAPRNSDGFGTARAVFVPDSGTTFDAFASTSTSLLVTRCFDEACESGAQNGIWVVTLSPSGTPELRKLSNVPYAWGVQPVDSLGVLVFTDGDDILAMPLEATEIAR